MESQSIFIKIHVLKPFNLDDNFVKKLLPSTEKKRLSTTWVENGFFSFQLESLKTTPSKKAEAEAEKEIP